MSKQIVFIVLLSLISFGCSIDYEKANANAVDSLHSRIKAEKFDKIYEQSADLVKSTIREKEFVEKMKLGVNSMKSIDTNLNWVIKGDQTEFYRDHSITDTSLRTLENGSENINIWIYWSPGFRLCGFNISDTIVFEACS